MDLLVSDSAIERTTSEELTTAANGGEWKWRREENLLPPWTLAPRRHTTGVSVSTVGKKQTHGAKG
jgi:hypothetical protein